MYKAWFVGKDVEGIKVAVTDAYSRVFFGYVIVEASLVFAPFKENVTFPYGDLYK